MVSCSVSKPLKSAANPEGIAIPAWLSWMLEFTFTGPAVLLAPFSVMGVEGMSKVKEKGGNVVTSPPGTPGITPWIRCVTTMVGSVARAWKMSPQPAMATSEASEASDRDSFRKESVMVTSGSVDEEEEAQAHRGCAGEERDVAAETSWLE